MLAACVWRGAGAVRGDDEKMAHKKGGMTREGGGVLHTACRARGDDGRVMLLCL